jgi:hypothetical protein
MKHIVYSLALLAALAGPALAQNSLTGAQLNFQYRQAIPQGGDTSAARAAILAEAEKDCAAAQKTFGLPCLINTIQFNTPGMGGYPFQFQTQAPGNFIGANVNMTMQAPRQPPQN